MFAQSPKLTVAGPFFRWKLPPLPPFSISSPLLSPLPLFLFLNRESFYCISTNCNIFLSSCSQLFTTQFDEIVIYKIFFCFFSFSYFHCDHTRSIVFFFVVFNGRSGPTSKFIHWRPVPGTKKPSSKIVHCVFINTPRKIVSHLKIYVKESA